MPRSIWKGAISFGLVHIPVAVVAATSSQGVDFDWLDERSMEPVGYKRINKVTGKEVSKENIVKGVEYEKGRYVVLSEEEIRAAHPKSTQTIDIFAFVEANEIPLENIEKPYYLAPDRRGEKVYALLRETLASTGKVALANVVLHTKQHLAALMPVESALELIMLRWPAEVRGLKSLELNESAIHPSLSKSELDMARRLVEGMTAHWQPEEYQDTFQEKIMTLVEQKARAGKIEEVETVGAPERKSADIIDLTELLKRSLRGEAAQPEKSGASSSPKATEKATGAKKTSKRSTAKATAQKPGKSQPGKSRSSAGTKTATEKKSRGNGRKSAAK